ncbi:MAG: PQQ-binding-like beta-propeller repeat protein [Verrucomicrobia bacterium]|nr:PQQ-binding-like beta-propeller repeat protein [Verrucomicrobiota bacterium]
MRAHLRQSLLASFCILCPLLASAGDWPCFHGPDGLGVSSESHLPTRWSSDQGIAWRRPLPGKGASSPIVVNGRIYVTLQTPDTGLHVVALNARGGEILWDREVGKGKVRANQLHNMATPTAVSDGRHVWARFGTGLLVCLDTDGKPVWERNLSQEFGAFNANHGMGTSPMLLDGNLLVACMHQGPSYLLTVNGRTGKTVWKTDRNLEPKDEAQDSYESPIIVNTAGRRQILLAGSEAVSSYEPKTGVEIWSHGGIKVPHPYGRTISGMAAGEGVAIVVASGFQNRGYTFGIPTAGAGKRPETDRLWTCAKFSPDCSTPVVYRGNVFLIRDDGMASCLDLKTGAARWQERLFSANVKVSPVAADGHVYFLSGEGTCYVLDASPTFKTIAENKLSEPTLCSPAISDGHIYLRTESAVYAVHR